MRIPFQISVFCLVASAAFAGDPPSVALSRFGGAHLDHILGPIEQNVNLPRTELLQIRESFLNWKAKAPPNEQPAWSMAVRVCDALNNAMDERENARIGTENSSTVHGSYDLGARRRDHLRNWREAERERHEEENRKHDAAQRDAFLNTTLRNNWRQRTMQLRQNIVAMHIKLQELERQSQDPGAVAAAVVSSDTVTLRQATPVHIKYGTVTLPPGTNLHVVSRDPRGITAEYNGELVIVPPQ
jgi:hypothetical protein